MASPTATSDAQSQRPSSPPRPLPQGAIDRGHRYTTAQRIHCLVLLAEGYPAAAVEQKSGVKRRQQLNIWKKAKERGFEPDKDPFVLETYVVDSERSGRPREISKDQEEGLLSAVPSNRAGREKSSEVLAYEQGIGYSSALRILHKNGLNSVNPTTTPGLTAAMREIRYEWALAHQDWTFEDWKNVIWSD
jgi:hypothetical protein